MPGRAQGAGNIERQTDDPQDEHEHRLPDPTAVGEGEFAKSRVTRTRIMEAGVECLARLGYSATTTGLVAEQAGLTRAAMLYHYPSRMSLMEAIIYYVTRRRVEMYAGELTRVDRSNLARFSRNAIDIMWAQLQTNEFLAFSELAIAARTDVELEELFAPALVEFDRARREMAVRYSAPERAAAPGFDLRRDIVRFLLEGIVQQRGITFDAERRLAEILEFLTMLYADGSADELLRKAERRARRRLQRRRST